MPYTIEYLEDLKIVNIVTDGEMYFEDYRQQIEEAIALAKQQNTGMFFSDLTRLQNRAEIGDVFRIYQLLKELSNPNRARIAVLRSQDHPDFGLIKIFELSCSVRGISVKCFHDKDVAFRWLLFCPPTPAWN